MKYLGIVLVVLILALLVWIGYKSIYNPSSSTNIPSVSKTSTPTPTNTIETNKVSIENFAFNPQTLTVTAETNITFKNNDSVAHTVTFADFDSNNIAPSATFQHIFNSVGNFSYFCSLHPNMKGTIIVQ